MSLFIFCPKEMSKNPKKLLNVVKIEDDSMKFKEILNKNVT